MAEEGTEAAKVVAQLEAINLAVKAAGFTTVEEMVASEAASKAKSTQLETDNTKAQEIIQAKGSEIGNLRTEVERLKEGKEKPGSKTEPPPPAEPKPEEKCAALEADFSDEEKARADEFLQGVEDQTVKEQIIADPKQRLKVMQGVRDSFSKPRNSFFEKPAETGGNVNANKGTDVSKMFDEFKSRNGYVPEGSSGGGGGGVPPKPKPGERKREVEDRCL